MINIEQTVKRHFCMFWAFFGGMRESRMSIDRRKEWEGLRIVALVEFDIQKLRVHIILSREAIAERVRELEHSTGIKS